MIDTRTLILDAETDNLLPMVTTIWVICTKVIETGEIREFFDGPSFLEYITELDPTHVVGQNHVGFDLEVLRRIWGVPYTIGKQCLWNNRPVRFVDTKLLSQFLNPDRVGGHSLESWGERLGFPKGTHTDWSQLSDSMREYCARDVEVTHKTLDYLIREIEEYG